MKSKLQPEFRQTFANNFNFNYDGEFIYNTPIGGVPSRPFGTDFEETSHAHIHRNVLIVTIDVLYQKSPSEEIGPAGTVTGAVNGEHLKWFDQILEAGGKDPFVKHIFVHGTSYGLIRLSNNSNS